MRQSVLCGLGLRCYRRELGMRAKGKKKKGKIESQKSYTPPSSGQGTIKNLALAKTQVGPARNLALEETSVMSSQGGDNIESKLEQAARNAVRDGNGTNLDTAELSDIVPGIDPEIVRGEDSSGVLAAAVHQHNQQHQQDRGDKHDLGQHHHPHAHELSHHQIDPSMGGQRDHHFHPEHNAYQHVQEPPPPPPQQPMPHERRVNRGPDGYPEPSHHGGENSRRRIRLTWTPDETQALIQGCRIHGVGNWKKILTDPSLKFNSRTAVDLKDRFRTSFPEEYSRLYPNAKTHRFKSKTKTVPPDDQAAAAAAVAAVATGDVPPPPSEASQDPATALANVSNDRGLGENLVKINRKERRAFTKEEDEQLLKGFQKHGPCWSKIQKDHSLNLFNRRSTDLRDRFRNRFPEKYTEAGYKGRGGGGRVRKKRTQTSSSHSDENTATLAAAAVMNMNNAANDNNSNPEDVKDENAPAQDQHQQPTDGFNYYQNTPMMQQIYQQSNQRQ